MKIAYLYQGSPFAGRAGGAMYKALEFAGIRSKDFLPMESVPDADVIFAIGPWAASELTGHRFTTDSMLRKRGYVYWDGKRKIIPLIDPAFVRAGKMNLIQTLIYDLKIAPTKEVPKIPYDNLTLYPSPESLSQWVETAIKDGEFGVCDIETPYSTTNPEDAETDDDSYTILRTSISYADHTGAVKAITFPFTEGYIPSLRHFLSSGLDIVYWNGDYDVPRLEFNQCSQKGRLIDAMWLFHFLFPDLPRSLGSAASFYTTLGEWKSLSSTEPELYSCLDSYATALCYLGIRKHLKEKGMWETAWRHVVLLQQVLRKMRNRGLIIDLKALESFKSKLVLDMAVLQEKINTLVPMSVRPVGVVNAKHLRGRCECATLKLTKQGSPTKKVIWNASHEKCSGTGWNPPIKSLLDFNPSSPDQVKALILSLSHPIPKVKDGEGGMKETTGERFLVDLVRMFPTAPYRTIVDYRKLNKMLTTYGEWPLQEVTEKHIDPLLFKKAATKLLLNPSTGRLSSINPNMQNIPKEGELADAFKRCIVARPGHRILKRDYSGIEAVLTGYFSKDPEAMRLALLGVHTYRAAQYFGEAPSLEQSDGDLGKALKILKKKYDTLKEGETSSIYQRFKKINHMGNYKAGAKEMFDKSPGVFNNLDEVKKLNAFFIKSSPLRSKWWKTVEFRCLKEHRIVTPFMYNRWFWDMPADLTKAVAMEPQSTAAAIIKEAMLTIDETDNGQYMVLQVHDELVFDLPIEPGSCLCCPENTKTWEKRSEDIKHIMESPIACLGGLVISTEPAGGANYASH